MRTELKVTDSTTEISFDDLAKGDQVVRIPLFQREYVWTKTQFKRLAEDIAQVDDAEGDTQFLGAIVAIEQPSGPGRFRPYEIVDGQQRLMTIYLIIAAAAHTAAEHDHTEFAADIISSYLLVRHFPEATANTRLIPCTKDRRKFADVWKFIIRQNPSLKRALREQPVPPPASDAYKDKGAGGEGTDSKLYEQFRHCCAYCEHRYEDRGLDGLKSLVVIVATRLSFIFISLKDPSSAPRIFENLNNAGVRTTVANLVRNEVFSRVSDDPERAVRVFQNQWEPFQGRFGDRFDDFFFPYGLTLDSNVKKATLFEELRKRWSGCKSPEEIIDGLIPAADAFLWVATDSFEPAGEHRQVSEGFLRLRRLGAPSSLNSFLMQLAVAAMEGRTTERDARATLDVIESFLVRRAVCGIEPTGLHAVFKGLWKETAGNAVMVTKSMRGRTTVPWPENPSFEHNVKKGEVYRRGIANYLMVEYEASLGADIPSNDPEIEHVMPITLKEGWNIPQKIHERWLHTWANLVAVSPGLNRSLKNESFEKKRARYAKESMYASPRAVAGEFAEWNEAALNRRAEQLASWAVARWPY